MSRGGNWGHVRVSVRAATALAAAALTLGAARASAAGTPPPPDPAVDATAAPAPLAHRVIVQWAAGADHSERVAAREEAGVTYRAMLGDPSFQLVVTQDGESAGAAAASLEEDPAVAVAEPDGLRRVEAIPNDPHFGAEWGLRNTGQTVNGLVGQSGNDINVVSAWNRTVGTPSTVVADIDTGYRSDSPDLGPVLWTNPGETPGNGLDDDSDGYVDDVHGWDFVGESTAAIHEDADPTDSNLTSGGHGVHTAGTIGAAGNDGTGVSGVARNVRIMPLRVCTNQPTDSEGKALNETRCPTSAIVAAINLAGVKGARVANLSLGGTTFNQIEVNAFAAHPGTLYVISAGNDSANDDSGGSGTAGHHYPCDYKPATESSPAAPGAIENTICVAALDPGGTLASYSDYGATSVDLGAPGSSVLSTFPATETLFSDNFEANDFATKWTPFGAGFGLAGASDGPLTSFGITDTPGAAPLANHTYDVKTTAGVAVPAGQGACRVEGKRYRKGGPTLMPYGLIEDGGTYREYLGGATSGSAMAAFRTVLIPGLAGHSVQPWFEYQAGGAPASTEGLWVDDVALRCNAPLSVPPTYSYLDGTSMAAPHVSGAAALLFSLKPGASVTEVRAAILGHTTVVAGLAGQTTTGGRLNVSTALNALVPPGTETTAPETELTTTTPAVTVAHTASFHARRVDADGGSLECKLDGGAFNTCGGEIEVTVAAGSHTLQVRAKNEAGIVDSTAASFTWTVDNTPPSLSITEGPSGTTTATGATFKFTASDPSTPVTIECSLDGAAFATCTSPTTYASLAVGGHEFKLRAVDALGNASSASRSWNISTSQEEGTVVTGTLPPGAVKAAEEQIIKASPPAQPEPPPVPAICTVPQLAGKTLGQAKAALTAAGCTFGKVTSPKARGAKLVVKSSTPAAGSKTSGAVGLKLAAKPKKHRRH